MKVFTLLIALLVVACTGARAQEWAKDKLNKSPRHLDWVTVKSGDRDVKCFIAYPEAKHKAPAVIVIHENTGLTDWARDVCDQLAEHGYIAIAPDLLSGKEVDGKPIDDIKKMIATLPPDQITSDLNAVADYVTKLPSTNHKLAVMGFCWGGGQSFRYATNNPNIREDLVFYGIPVENPDDVAKIKAPVYGFYGESDNRITSTVDATEKRMKDAGKKYYPQTYTGAGHGFMRAGEAPADPAANDAAKKAYEANQKAHDEGWQRLLTTLQKM